MALSEHQQKNPGYKFMPASRGSRRNKSGGPRDPISDKTDKTCDIREKYLNIMGPSPASMLKWRQQKVHSVDTERQTEKQTSIPLLFTAFDSKTPSFPPPTTKAHHVSRINQSPPLTSHRSMSLYRPMTTFSEPTMPRRPSTSLGFQPPPNEISYGSPDLRVSCTRPPSAASLTFGFFDYVRAHGKELLSAVSFIASPASLIAFFIAFLYLAVLHLVLHLTPCSTIDTSTGSEPIISGTIDSTEHQANLPSPSSLDLYGPMDYLNPSTTAPAADTASSESILATIIIQLMGSAAHYLLLSASPRRCLRI